MQRSLGPWVIEAELGAGAQGRVLKARHRDSGIARAVKVIPLATDAEAVARFQREAETLARVGGTGVVAVHEAGVQDGHLYLVMDLMPGGSLRDRLKKRGVLPWREAATIVRDLARGLSRCHAAGIVHRDVKPENVLFDDAGAPRLSDFGLVIDRQGGRLTQSGMIVGTPLYLPPEQLTGQRATEATDVWALGAVLHELVTGAPPYQGATWVDVHDSAASGKRKPIQLPPGEAPSLEGLVGRLLNPSPAKRLTSATEVAAILDALLARRTGVYAVPAAPPPRGRTVAIVLLAIGGVLVLGLAFAIATIVARRGAPPLVEVPAPPRAAPATPPAPAPAPPAPAPAPPKALPPGTTPRWYEELPSVRRPKLPLPFGVAFSTRPGEYVHAKTGLVLCYVPGASYETPVLEFAMDVGGEGRRTARPPLQDVTTPPFFIAKHEVTNALFQRFTNEAGYSTTTERKACSQPAYTLTRVDSKFAWVPAQDPWGIDALATWKRPSALVETAAPDHPVVCVSFHDAYAFSRWATLDLPTADQWMTAAGWDPETATLRELPWGGDYPKPGEPNRANLRDRGFLLALGVADPPPGPDDGASFTAPVGSFPRDVAPSGALDLAGNVAEWAWRSATDKSIPKGRELQSICGTSFNAVPTPDWLDVRRRQTYPADVASQGIGFRVAIAARR